MLVATRSKNSPGGVMGGRDFTREAGECHPLPDRPWRGADKIVAKTSQQRLERGKGVDWWANREALADPAAQ